jgi:hypothetical protein
MEAGNGPKNRPSKNPVQLRALLRPSGRTLPRTPYSAACLRRSASRVWRQGRFFDLGHNAKVDIGGFAFGGFLACRVLVVEAEPTDMAERFLPGTFFVQGHEAQLDVFVRQVQRPTIGIGEGGVDLVV